MAPIKLEIRSGKWGDDREAVPAQVEREIDEPPECRLEGREVRELRRANEILKAASAFFAAELDPRLPKS